MCNQPRDIHRHRLSTSIRKRCARLRDDSGVPTPLELLLHRQHGVVSRRQAARHLTVRVIERRLSSGRWQAPHRGVYVTHSGPLDRQQRRWVAVLGAGAGRVALLGGLSALETLGLRGFGSDRTDVLLPARFRSDAPPSGVVTHRTTHLPSAHLHRLGDPPGTTAERSLIDAAQWAPSDRAARTIVAAAMQQRLVLPDSLRSVLARMPRARRRALIAEMIDYAAVGVESATEADFLRLCRQQGYPEPLMRHPRTDAAGRKRYLDAYFADFKLHVEIDGGHHIEIQQWWTDMQRQNDLWIAGDRILRFPAWVITARPGDVASQLRAALTAAGWRSPTF